MRPTPSVLVKVKGKACYLISELVNVKGEYNYYEAYGSAGNIMVLFIKLGGGVHCMDQQACMILTNLCALAIMINYVFVREGSRHY